MADSQVFIGGFPGIHHVPFSSRARLTGITGPIGEKGFGKAIIGTRVLDLAGGTVGLLSCRASASVN